MNTSPIEDLELKYYEKSKNLLSEYREKIKAFVDETLKDAGLYDTKCRCKKDGKIGYIRVMPSSYSSVKPELKFQPIRKDGELSKNLTNIYSIRITSNILKDKLLDEFEPITD